MTKEKKLQVSIGFSAKLQFCPDCGAKCVQRLLLSGTSFLCVDCEEDPPWFSAPSAMERLVHRG